jgi:integrase
LDCTIFDTPHATLAIRAGVSPKVISERLGHHPPEFTMHQYAHVLSGMQADAAARIADLVASAEVV